MQHQRRIPLLAFMLASSLAAAPLHADVNPADLVNQATEHARGNEPGLLSRMSPQHLETAKNVLEKIDREALCAHLDVSRARFEEVLGERKTQMRAIKTALDALEQSNVKAFCRGA